MRRIKGLVKPLSSRKTHSPLPARTAPLLSPLKPSQVVWVQVTHASVRDFSSKLCVQLSIFDEESVGMAMQSLGFPSYEDFLVRDCKGPVLYFQTLDRWSDSMRARVGSERGNALSSVVLEDWFWTLFREFGG